MSRSYRRPALAITGNGSAKQDKMLAARGVRRAQNRYVRLALKQQVDLDEFLIPHRYECSWNETYVWGRDGCQRLYFRSDFDRGYFSYVTGEWVPLYDDPEEAYQKLCRK